MWVTVIGGPNAVKRFCSNTVLLSEFHLWSKYMVSDYVGRRTKRTWPNCILCIPFMFSRIPNECWLHKWDACVITTCRLGLWTPLVHPHNLVTAQNKTKYLNNQLCINTSESTDHRNVVTKNYWYSPNLNGASRVFLQNFKDFEMFCQSVIYHSVLSNDDGNRQGKCHC